MIMLFSKLIITKIDTWKSKWSGSYRFEMISHRGCYEYNESISTDGEVPKYFLYRRISRSISLTFRARTVDVFQFLEIKYMQ